MYAHITYALKAVPHTDLSPYALSLHAYLALP